MVFFTPEFHLNRESSKLNFTATSFFICLFFFKERCIKNVLPDFDFQKKKSVYQNFYEI